MEITVANNLLEGMLLNFSYFWYWIYNSVLADSLTNH